MIQALIFDFDGLLVDTETPAFESWQSIYGQYGHALSLEHWQGALGTMHGFDALEYLEGLVGRPIDRRAEMERRRSIKALLSAEQPLLPGVREILQQAQDAQLPCAVASSSERAWVEGWLSRHVILDAFVCVRTADDVVLTKPSPDLFLSAAQGLGIAPSACLVFEDSPNGILAARAAGMRVVAVPGAITSRLALPQADLVIASLDALPLAEIIEKATY